jgi:hypothetical protein
MNSEQFQLRKIRDFGERISDTIQFIKINWGNLLKLYAVFVVPFLLAGVILGANSLADFLTKFSGDLNSISGLFGWKMLGAGIMFLLSGASYAAVIYLYMDHFETNHGVKPSVSDIGKNYFQSLVTNIGYSLLVVLAFIPIALILTGIAISSKGQVGLFLLAIPFFLFFGLFAMVLIVMIYPVNIIGKGRFGTAISATFRLLKGRWWFSLGYFFILMIIYYFFALAISTAINIVFGLTAVNFTDPAQITKMGKGYMYVFGLTTLVQQVFYIIIFVGTGLHYYSTMEEKLGSGLEQKIEELGMLPRQNTRGEEY